jgi:peptidoglycan/xylan/chitin deacetylase (PgdA/CDA1 family)
LYSIEQYTGINLPEKVLCLTYDDGPGKITREIAEYLNSEDIRATFFVVGKYAYHNADILQSVKNLGHLIANHTYDHPDLPYYVSIGGDVHDQILRTDTLIKQYSDTDIMYFRAPYGKWSKETANEFNSNTLASINYVGPIHWDVTGIDCYYWQNDWSVDAAIEKYLEEINEKKRGIVVMHDDIADMDYIKHKNNTLELTQKLIPILKQQGYSFVRLDEIDAIKRASEKLTGFNLAISKNWILSLSSNTEVICTKKNKSNSGAGSFHITNLTNGKVAIRASNGMYLNSKDNNIQANSSNIGEYESFDLVPVNNKQIILRSYNGYYLTCDSKPGAKLQAGGQHMRQAEIFEFNPLYVQTKTQLSFKDRASLVKKRLLFIKSKIFNS